MAERDRLMAALLDEGLTPAEQRLLPGMSDAELRDYLNGTREGRAHHAAARSGVSAAS